MSFVSISVIVVATTMKNINGYGLAARICYYLMDDTTDFDFPQFCVDFGPECWDKLQKFQKYYFKRLAQWYKTTAVGRAERYDGEIPTKEQLLAVLFHERAEEQNVIIELLTPYANVLLNNVGV